MTQVHTHTLESTFVIYAKIEDIWGKKFLPLIKYHPKNTIYVKIAQIDIS